jgi:hypothetical protein
VSVPFQQNVAIAKLGVVTRCNVSAINCRFIFSFQSGYPASVLRIGYFATSRGLLFQLTNAASSSFCFVETIGNVNPAAVDPGMAVGLVMVV